MKLSQNKYGSYVEISPPSGSFHLILRVYQANKAVGIDFTYDQTQELIRALQQGERRVRDRRRA